MFLKISGWTSEYSSVTNLLRYLKCRKTGSASSRKTYCEVLYLFCRYAGRMPDDLVKLSTEEIENLVEEFGYRKREKLRSPRTINTYFSNLKTFFSVNGFRNEKELDVEQFHQPARARAREEYVPSVREGLEMAKFAENLRDKMLILFMVFSGLRNSTLRALRYGDVKEELENGKDTILIRVYPAMKECVPSACKGNIEYFTFIPKLVVDLLRRYVAQMQEKVGNINDQNPLFPSQYNQLPREDRFSKPLSDKQLQSIVKQVAKDAGIKKWKLVTPHCLRKTFETFLRSQLDDGSRLDMPTQIFLMGHTQPGGLQPYFDSNIEDLRALYSKLVPDPNEEKLIKMTEVLRITSALLETYDARIRSSGKDDTSLLDLSTAVKVIQSYVKEIQRTDKVSSKSATDPAVRAESSTDTSKPQSEMARATGSNCNSDPLRTRMYRFSQKKQDCQLKRLKEIDVPKGQTKLTFFPR